MFKKLIFSLWVFTTLLFGANFEDGVSAYKKGDFKTAFTILEDLASQGDGKAQAVLGAMYSEGKGVKQDYKKAIEWHEKAAYQGYSVAQYNLGKRHKTRL